MPFLDHALRIIYLLYILTVAAAAPRNITIDDELGDELTGNRPSFSPLLGWAQGAVCDGCLKLDAGQTIQRTWHDHTHRSNETRSAVSFPFSGTAVFVYCILANNLTGITTLANYSFFLDGAEVGRFIHVPENGSDFQYNVLVYSNTSVPNGNHTFQLLADSNVSDTLILFDYAQYTLDIDAPATIRAQLPDTESPPANQQSNSTASLQQTAAIVAGVLGGVAITGLGIILYLLRHRLRRRPAGPSITPFPLTDMSRSRVEEQLGDDRPRGQPRGRQSGPTSGGRRARPRAQPEPITPFKLQQPINPQPEKGARPALRRYRLVILAAEPLAQPLQTTKGTIIVGIEGILNIRVPILPRAVLAMMGHVPRQMVAEAKTKGSPAPEAWFPRSEEGGFILQKATLPNPHLRKALLGTLRFLLNQNSHRHLEVRITEAGLFDMLAWNQTHLFRRLRLLIEGRITSSQKSERPCQIFRRSTKP
ncbi:hypothetical protein PC9H_006677 [Pleurotus ostreatus]|uniref:Uncharacterized protein n=1 Tax=Pleurotus ostreatus TaxID=5322 RepID=A0A8H6ZYE1_PLEOS|nr:uncharacterized protein PC9H_006677 [Pleurotus ostreatus]KAF7430962.1 hypothetical protein PC9H_006677 [Pleurotus ostreatus]